METSAERHDRAHPRYVDVAVDAPTAGARGQALTYAVPAQLAGRLAVGQLVWVPLRRELKLGLVVRLHDETPGFNMRPLHAPVEPEFRLTSLQWKLAQRISNATLCPLFEAATPFFPPGVSHRSVEHLRLREGVDLDALTLTPVQRQLVDLLRERGELSLEAARRALDRPLTSVVDKLVAVDIIERVARVHRHQVRPALVRFVRLLANGADGLERAPAQRRALEVVRRRATLAHGAPIPWDDLVKRPGVTARSLSALAERGLVEIVEIEAPGIPRPPGPSGGPLVQLTARQAAAWQHILGALKTGEPHEILLHGVTGSGKTELYLRATAWCLGRGRQVIVLVPEIALAAQVVARFTSRFPGQVAVLHSALPDQERYLTWRAIADGSVPVVVGPRSALFAPLDRLGLIIIDEEHESAYKQDAPPRYHARQVARHLADLSSALLLLGSATPDIETYYATQTNDVTLIELPERVAPGRTVDAGRGRSLELPEVEVVDMRQELQQGNLHIFSRALQQQLELVLRAGEQAILFLNRRGMSTLVQCRACGHIEDCPFCDVPLVYHQDRRQLICHRCNHRALLPVSCPDCGSESISYYGTGTQRVEREVKRLYPAARVLRWDQDALRGRVRPENLIQRVVRHEVDIVVGTQMVAKGLDFPRVSTIGVINADTLLHLPDFRSAERTFQLLTQVAGRAGRRTAGGRVIVQSYSIDHYAIQAASRHDYASFYADEIVFRRKNGYPPFKRLVRLLYRHTDETTCQNVTEQMADLLARTAYRLGLERIDLLGPTPAFSTRVRGRYQWQIILRGDDAHRLAANVEFDPGWIVDVDPGSLL